MKRLVAKEFTWEAEDPNPVTFPVGYKYIRLVNPLTDKIYEPIPGWEVTGEDLSTLFREVGEVEIEGSD